MAWRLFGTKPLHEPMLTYCQLDPEKQISVEFEPNYKNGWGGVGVGVGWGGGGVGVGGGGSMGS